jgi:hypothetical protein
VACAGTVLAVRYRQSRHQPEKECVAGAVLGYLIFTVGLGIGDTDLFDFGGIISAIIGTVIVILIAGFFLRRRGTTGL